jgi:hypothetical protein
MYAEHALFTRTVEEAPGIRMTLHPLHITRLTVGSLLSISSTVEKTKGVRLQLDICLLANDLHRIHVAP